ISLPHAALDPGNGVAHHAPQSSPGLRTVHDLFDRRIKQPAVQQSRIVASGAPFRRLYADHILHVLNALAIPLVIKGGEVVHRAIPLIENVLVATLAGRGLHEVFARYLPLMHGLRGTGEERASGAVALAFHGEWRRFGISDFVRAEPPALPDLPAAHHEPSGQEEEQRIARELGCT